MASRCTVDSAPFIDSYLQFAITNPIFLLLQFLLLYNTITNYQALKKIDIKIRFLYFSMQIATILFLLIELLKNVILPHDIRNSSSQFYCNMASYNPMICILSYFLLLLYLFYRLDFTFKGSVYRLSKFSRIFLSLFLCVPPLSSIVIFPILADDACIWDWHPFDLNEPNLYLCATDYSSDNQAIYVVYVCLVWDVVMNIIIAVLFYRKLKQILDGAGGSRANRHTMQTKRLMMKNTILTMCCVVSTLISWILWLVFNLLTYGKCIVYLDLWINGVCIALMFKFNEKYYKMMCGRCTKCFITEEQLKMNIGILDESTRMTSSHPTPDTVSVHQPVENTQRMELTSTNTQMTQVLPVSNISDDEAQNQLINNAAHDNDNITLVNNETDTKK
eukprot:158245_1